MQQKICRRHFWSSKDIDQVFVARCKSIRGSNTAKLDGRAAGGPCACHNAPRILLILGFVAERRGLFLLGVLGLSMVGIVCKQ